MNKLKQNTSASFIIISIVYIFASVVGILFYRSLNFDWWLSLLIADTVATIFTFVFSLIFGNASVYDPYWSVQPPVILIAFAIGKRLTVLGILLIVAVYVAGNMQICPNMKKITLEKVRDALLGKTKEVILEKDFLENAHKPLIRMLELAK